MKPCKHETAWLPDPYHPDKGYCRICYLFETDEDYRRLWTDGVANPTTVVATARRPLPCIFLGKRVTREPCQCPRLDQHLCDLGHGIVRQADHCERCGDYQPDQL